MSKTYRYTGSHIVLAGCLMFLAFAALYLILVAIGAFILMVAWNLVLPSLFGWTALTYPMALGLSLLIAIIGGAFSRGSKS